jgi:hypothetical protein
VDAEDDARQPDADDEHDAGAERGRAELEAAGDEHRARSERHRAGGVSAGERVAARPQRRRRHDLVEQEDPGEDRREDERTAAPAGGQRADQHRAQHDQDGDAEVGQTVDRLGVGSAGPRARDLALHGAIQDLRNQQPGHDEERVGDALGAHENEHERAQEQQQAQARADEREGDHDAFQRGAVRLGRGGHQRGVPRELALEPAFLGQPPERQERAAQTADERRPQARQLQPPHGAER